MLNIKEFETIKQASIFSAEDKRTAVIVIALVEQRMVLERIAELLDVHHTNLLDIESNLNRIAGALEVMVSDDDPDDDKSEKDEPDGNITPFNPKLP